MTQDRLRTSDGFSGGGSFRPVFGVTAMAGDAVTASTAPVGVADIGFASLSVIDDDCCRRVADMSADCQS